LKRDEAVVDLRSVVSGPDLKVPARCGRRSLRGTVVEQGIVLEIEVQVEVAGIRVSVFAVVAVAVVIVDQVVVLGDEGIHPQRRAKLVVRSPFEGPSSVVVRGGGLAVLGVPLPALVATAIAVAVAIAAAGGGHAGAIGEGFEEAHFQLRRDGQVVHGDEGFGRGGRGGDPAEVQVLLLLVVVVLLAAPVPLLRFLILLGVGLGVGIGVPRLVVPASSPRAELPVRREPVDDRRQLHVRMVGGGDRRFVGIAADGPVLGLAETSGARGEGGRRRGVRRRCRCGGRLQRSGGGGFHRGGDRIVLPVAEDAAVADRVVDDRRRCGRGGGDDTGPQQRQQQRQRDEAGRRLGNSESGVHGGGKERDRSGKRNDAGCFLSLW